MNTTGPANPIASRLGTSCVMAHGVWNDTSSAATRTHAPFSCTEATGKTSVWLFDPATMTVKAQPVQVGGADGNAVVIAAGLQPGQEVVTAGVHVLTPGQKVKRYVPDAVAAAAAPAASAVTR